MTSPYSRQTVGRLIADGQLDEAEQICRKALGHEQSDPTVYINLAHIAYQKRSIDEARELLLAALGLDQENPSALHNLGVIADQSGDLAAAEDYYRRAVAADPEYLAPQRNLASLLLDQGAIGEAREIWADVIARSPYEADAHFAYSRVARYTEDDPTLPALQALTQRGRDLGTDAQIKISFTVGKANQDLGRYRDAFLAYKTGNELHYRLHPYPEAPNYAMLSDMRRQIDRDFVSNYTAAGVADPLPIFVLGMPRSGSTLVERMLAAHPDVSAAGEVDYLKKNIQAHLVGDRQTIANARPEWTESTLAGCATAYLEELRAHAGTGERVVDKMPGNYAFIGLIAAMLPEARIVHTVRHPMATIWSNYSTLFSSSLDYTYDLEVLARYYGQYEQTMQHWRSVLPDDRVFELEYEQLVRDPEPTLRKLLDYLGLPWDAACLDFHRTSGQVRTASVAQVRQPLYTAAVDLWQNYRPELAPVEALLRTY